MRRAIVLRAVMVGLAGLALALGPTPAACSKPAFDEERMTQMIKMMGEMREQMQGMREQMQGMCPMHSRMEHMMGQMRAMMEHHRGQMSHECPSAGSNQPPVPHT
jgi:hypothetical protein